MDTVSSLKNNYYKYANYVVPKLSSAVVSISSAKDKIATINVAINKGFSIDGDRSVDEYMTDLYKSLNDAYESINTELTNAKYRRDYLYKKWKEKETEEN